MNKQTKGTQTTPINTQRKQRKTEQKVKKRRKQLNKPKEHTKNMKTRREKTNNHYRFKVKVTPRVADCVRVEAHSTLTPRTHTHVDSG